MLRFGITGRSGTGKSTVAALFAPYGVHHLDADRVVHDLYSPGSPCAAAVAARFGGDLLTGEGRVDRRRLGQIVFADPGALRDLERIVHRFVGEEIAAVEAEQARLGARALLVDAIALIEGGQHTGPLVVVTAPYALQLARIMARDGIDEAAARARLDAQKPESFFLDHADYVIHNTGDLEALRRQVDEVAARLGLLP
ncbi:MAG: dephospho-CoA kinase [Clostridiales bacterium]|nr:dephospho-CoA kinase [Clostridiales bacterium]